MTMIAHIEDVLAGKAEPLRPDTKIRWQCNLSGECCFGTPVLVSPHDVWRMIVEKPETMARLGIRTTCDLYHPSGRPPFLALYIGEQSKLPVSAIVQVPHGPKLERCPFLSPTLIGTERLVRKALSEGRFPEQRKTVDGRPMWVCGIHDARPTVCRSFPFGRARHSAKNGKFRMAEGEQILIDNREACAGCYEGYDRGPETTVAEFLAASGVDYGQTDLWWSLLDRLADATENESLRRAVGVLAYDFDHGWQGTAHRAGSYQEHMGRVGDVISALAERDLAKFKEVVGSLMRVPP